MIDELAILNGLKAFIVAHYAEYRDTGDTTTFAAKEIMVDSPDIDAMTSNCNIWLEPNSVDIDTATFGSDEATFSVKLCIIVKKGKSSDLQAKIFHIKNALYRLLKNNQGLDGLVDLISIESYNYYPQLYDELGIVGMDIDLNIIYNLDFFD